MSGLPFTAVVGQHEAKRALLLAAVQPQLAGVLLRGDKGSAKTTLARGLAALLPGDAPFVELPLGATEERVIGSVDLVGLFGDGQARFRPGLLADAHGGVLYVDEINLLADHLVDALLDVAVSGVNRVERDGVSHSHPARFVLVGSMNPEEGELRPQLLDRFGLAVEVTAPLDVADRVLAVRRQLAHEQRSAARAAGDADADADADAAQLRAELARAASSPGAVVLDDVVLRTASQLALEVGAEGLRADLMLCRAAAACAALDGREHASLDDLCRVAPLVLAHRRRRRPFDEPGIAPDELQQAWERATAPPPGAAPEPDAPGPDAAPPGGEAAAGAGPGGAARRGAGPDGATPGERTEAPASSPTMRLPEPPPGWSAPRRPSSAAPRGTGAAATGPAGRFLRSQPLADPADPVHALSSALAVGARRAAGDAGPAGRADLRGARHEHRQGTLVVFVVDASGSMGVEKRMAATKAAVIGLLGDAYRRRGRVALITFRGERADVVLRPTSSVEIARARLATLATGGTTPIGAGLDAARTLVERQRGDGWLDCHVVVLTDGRATVPAGVAGADPVGAGALAAARLAATGARCTVIDTEAGATRLGLAARLAHAMGATCVALDELAQVGVEGFVRTADGRG